MKTILAPIDYSETSVNALHYAAGIAMEGKAHLIILHVYNLPADVTAGVPVIISPATLEKDNQARIEKVKKEITRRVKNHVKVTSVVRAGFADSQILHTAKEKKVDLIVMGLTGAGPVMQSLTGSTTLSVLKKSTTPVLVIPEKAKFHKTAKIVYASDFEKIDDHSNLDLMKELAGLFDSEIMVLNVQNNKVTVPAVVGASEGIELEHWFGGVKHSYWHSEEPDIIAAVNDFAEKHHGKIIAMFARRHLFPENIGHRSVTKRMALHTHVPFLSMHE